MKTLQLCYITYLLQASLAQGARVSTREVPRGARIQNNEIHWTEPDCHLWRDYPCDEITRRCYDGQRPTLTPDQQHFACCGRRQHLSGSVDTEFHCCVEGHEVVGSNQVGYQCCLVGETFNGRSCEKVCKNGRKLVNGQCACPPGTVESFDGSCEARAPPADCVSGLTTGKCYAFKADNGNNLGYHNDGRYYADSGFQQHSKFQLCKDDYCTPGLPVNPSDRTYIRDVYTDPRKWGGYHTSGKWLDNSSHNGHVRRTADFSNAGEFSLSKWPCGKYCLGGFDWGLGPSLPSTNLALAFYDGNDQMCVPFVLNEVPCDIHSNENNCVWRNGQQQCCGGVDCRDREL